MTALGADIEESLSRKVKPDACVYEILVAILNLVSTAFHPKKWKEPLYPKVAAFFRIKIQLSV